MKAADVAATGWGTAARLFAGLSVLLVLLSLLVVRPATSTSLLILGIVGLPFVVPAVRAGVARARRLTGDGGLPRREPPGAGRSTGTTRTDEDAAGGDEVSVTPFVAQPLPTDELPPFLATSASGCCADRGRLGPAWVHAASTVGQSHVREGIPREDAYAMATRSADSCAVVVTDGVGNARLANVASQKAAVALVARISDWAVTSTVPWREFVADAVSATAAGLGDHRLLDSRDNVLWTQAPLSALEQKLESPATTVVGVALRRSAGRSTIHWLACGDSALLRLGPDGWDWISGTADTVQAATASLPKHAEAVVQGSTELADDDVVVLATDGVADAIRDHPAEFAGAIHQALCARVSAAAFASILDFDIAGLTDDKTLVVIAAT